MNQLSSPRQVFDAPRALTFSPLAWLKLQFFCHRGHTEIGGFGIAADKDLLYVRDFVTVRQKVTPMSVRFEDLAVADFFDACVDQGLAPCQCGRIWLHTHPGSSVEPSGTDEETFARVFGACDWAVMFILGRTARTYARLSFSAGPGGQLLIPVQVDWPSWPAVVGSQGDLGALLEKWEKEYAAHIQAAPEQMLQSPGISGRRRGESEHAEFYDPWFEDFYDELYFDPNAESGYAATRTHSSGATG